MRLLPQVSRPRAETFRHDLILESQRSFIIEFSRCNNLFPRDLEQVDKILIHPSVLSLTPSEQLYNSSHSGALQGKSRKKLSFFSGYSSRTLP